MRQIHRDAWLLAFLSGVLQILAFPLPNLYPLSWFAIAPLLMAVLRAREPEEIRLPAGLAQKYLPATPLQGFFLGYVSGIMWYAGTCYWVYHTMHQYGGLSAAAAAGILVLFCLYLGVYEGLFGLVVALLAGGRAAGSRRALFLSPFVWVALELARTRISGFPWDLLGTAQVNNISLSRLATITGVYGVSFEIMLVNTVFAAAFLVGRDKRKVILVEGLVVAAALQLLALIHPAPLRTDHNALLVQENIPILPSDEWTPQYFQSTITDLVRLSMPPEAPAVPKPDLVVWPESPAPFYVNDPRFRQVIAAVAEKDHAYVLAGSLGENPGVPAGTGPAYNSAGLMSPQGQWVARYDKIHLVPFGEYVPFKSIFGFAGGLTQAVGEFGRGSSREPLVVDGYKLGVFICYESVFPGEVRQFAQNGGQVFVNISNDGWYGDTGAWAQHLNQARMRAVENNRWLLRDTNTGLTASIDPYGRVIAHVPRKQRTALEAPYALVNGTTFYTRYGDWFAYLCAIISVAALLWRYRVPSGKVSS
ncbi:MAG TPA: apolipoprotein N-acyltransferase [Terriglobales bacterium]|nr:apolipoprotein N-acyltransferase [Terriglobales bacterium]